MAERPHGYTIFCDDVRVEVSGKVSYIGCYAGGDLILHGDFPFTLPKFCIVATYIEDATDPARNIEILIYLPGDESAKPSIVGELEVTRDVPKKTADKNEVDAFSKPIRRMTAHLVISPLIFNKEELIKVRAKRGEEVIPMGTIAVKRRAEATAES